MKLAGVELRRIQMPLVAPFRPSVGPETPRDILLLRGASSGPAGRAAAWGGGAGGGGREGCGGGTWGRAAGNPAYPWAGAGHWAKVGELGLLLIEQPVPEEDVLGHASLAKVVSTPICLDESITSARTAAAAITLGACQVINIKPGRVGGYLAARRIHDAAAAPGLAVGAGGAPQTGRGV